MVIIQKFEVSECSGSPGCFNGRLQLFSQPTINNTSKKMIMFFIFYFFFVLRILQYLFFAVPVC